VGETVLKVKRQEVGSTSGTERADLETRRQMTSTFFIRERDGETKAANRFLVESHA